MHSVLPPEPPRLLRFELNGRTIAWILGAAAGVWLFLQLWPILLVIVVALMIVGALNPFVTRLEHAKVKRRYAIALVFASLFVFVSLFGALTVPRFLTQVSDLLERLPETQAALIHHFDRFKVTAPLAKSLRETKSTELVGRIATLGLNYSPQIIEVVAYAASSFFLALYLIVDRDRMRGAAFSLIPRAYHVRVSRILLNLETIVGGYVRGQVITSVMMAAYTFLVMTLAGVPNAVAFSLFAGVADVLPYIGALCACAPPFVAALSRGPSVAIGVLVALYLYQMFETRLVVPRVYGKVLRLPAAAVMISLLVGGKLLGITGALLALPIAAGIRMIVEELRFELPGEAIDVSEERQLDELEEQDFERRAAGAPAIEAAAIASEIAEARHELASADPVAAAEVPVTQGLSGH